MRGGIPAAGWAAGRQLLPGDVKREQGHRRRDQGGGIVQVAGHPANSNLFFREEVKHIIQKLPHNRRWSMEVADSVASIFGNLVNDGFAIREYTGVDLAEGKGLSHCPQFGPIAGLYPAVDGTFIVVLTIARSIEHSAPASMSKPRVSGHFARAICVYT